MMPTPIRAANVHKCTSKAFLGMPVKACTWCEDHVYKKRKHMARSIARGHARNHPAVSS